MPKYSTGGGGGAEDGGACELCGAESEQLRTATIAGATLAVCPSCRPHDDRTQRSSRTQDDQGERKRKAARRMAEINESGREQSSHWAESGTDYADDPLPYLVSDYSDRVRSARQSAGLSVTDLAEELGVEPETIHAVEEGRAARAGVGGSVIEAIADHFEIELVE